MPETDDEIREIKKEIIEARGLNIKTNNLVSSLSGDIKAIAKRQAGYERRFIWNGAVAYALFVVLCFLGLKLAFDAQIREIASDQDDLNARVEQLNSELEDGTGRARARQQAEERAYTFYNLIRQDKRSEAVDAYEAVREEPLSRAEAAIFRDTVDTFRLELSVAAFNEGLDRMRTGRYAEAADKFERAIELESEGPHIPQVRLDLARAYRRLNRQGEAILLAQQVVNQNSNRELQPDAVWLWSQCAEELNRLDEARNALRTLIRRWPRSALTPDARRHLGDLNMRIMRGGSNPN